MLLSIVIPTYGREEVLCETIRCLLALAAPADEIVVVDQTTDHRPPTSDLLTGWHQTGAIRWIRQAPPGTVGAMNRGLLEAQGDVVLFLDDDIIPGGTLVAAHRQAHAHHPEAWAVVGQVLQPEDAEERAEGGKLKAERGTETERAEGGKLKAERGTETERAEGGKLKAEGERGRAEGGKLRAEGERGRAEGGKLKAEGTTEAERAAEGQAPELGTRDSDHPASAFIPHPSSLTQDMRFAFNGGNPAWVANVMAGNLCVNRERALRVGGFDANFTPPVAYRFETEFAKRLLAAGGRIWFEPRASIRHLRAARGGTRSQGSHLNSASPVHGVGDYYFALRCGHGWGRVAYMACRPVREVRTRFHLRHPWFIPVKLLGETRALLLALRLWRQGPRLLPTKHTNGHE